MPNRNQILEQLNKDKSMSQDIIRRRYLKNLHNYTKNDTIVYFANFSPKFPNVGSAVSINLDDLSGFMTCLNKLKGETLDIIIHSPGGQADASAYQMCHCGPGRHKKYGCQGTREENPPARQVQKNDL